VVEKREERQREKARGRRKEDSDWRQPGLKATDFSPQDDVSTRGERKNLLPYERESSVKLHENIREERDECSK